ncbi:extracellular solute-binding protein [Salinarimonas sp.]|uniref:extracellular solute-binding protein n=1 Tax=Salinarimonas sp. TaxID=2766526 RepID=UPI003918C77F
MQPRFAALAFAVALPLALVAPGAAALAAEEGPAWRHGAALMGEPRYEPGFPHFDYVNPDAPKGGLLRLGALGSFDNFNPIVAGIRGDLAAGIGLVYETLTTSALDEPATEYGLIAEAMHYPEDYSSVTFRLNPNARWHDGEPIRVSDVIWSFEVQKEANPMYAFYYRNVVGAEETGEREVTFRFDQANNRELPKIMGQLLVLPEHWWTAPGRSPSATTLEPPLGSGPYRLATHVAGRSVVYERVPDAWANDLNVNVGKNNFGTIRYEYFRDATVLLEAFKADQVDFRNENVARNWATAYDFPARAEGRVVLESFPINSTGIMQAYVLNLRQERFQDPRVRRAFNLAFDFDDINRTIFFSAYERVSSFFHGTELASSGLPEGLELEILEEFRGQIPDSVFEVEYRNPDHTTPQAKRDNLREAVRLLQEAGYELRGRQMVDTRTGRPLTLEFLGFQSTDERHALPYSQALARIGVTMNVRIVDPAQYQNRLRSFDFDMITSLWAQSLSPGNEQRNYWGSEAANRPGSDNHIGVQDPAIDALIERVIFARDREELVAATRALDRVLLHKELVVPQWTLREQRIARWDRFSRPDELPEYGASAFPTVWWFDEEKARRAGRAQ